MRGQLWHESASAGKYAPARQSVHRDWEEAQVVSLRTFQLCSPSTGLYQLFSRTIQEETADRP
jgi:hypothetical protein